MGAGLVPQRDKKPEWRWLTHLWAPIPGTWGWQAAEKGQGAAGSMSLEEGSCRRGACLGPDCWHDFVGPCFPPLVCSLRISSISPSAGICGGHKEVSHLCLAPWQHLHGRHDKKLLLFGAPPSHLSGSASAETQVKHSQYQGIWPLAMCFAIVFCRHWLHIVFPPGFCIRQ